MENKTEIALRSTHCQPVIRECADNAAAHYFSLEVMNESFENYAPRKILVKFHGSRSLTFLAVKCVSQSRFYTAAKLS